MMTRPISLSFIQDSSISPPLKIGDSLIKPSSSVKNLGVVFDDEHRLEKAISSVCQGAHHHIYSIGKIRKYLTRASLETLVHALITSKLDYCNSLLSGASVAQIQRLQRVQNTAARLVSGRRKFDHITPVLKELHWLPVAKRIEFKIALLVFKILHNLAPDYLTELITPYHPARDLRSAGQNLLVVPPSSTSILDGVFSVVAPRLWNSLPQQIRDVDDINIFKTKLKTLLFHRSYV